MEEDKTFQKLRENEREVRKNLILDAALNVFEKKTFYKTSMNDIAKELGVSTATLYSYFSSQEALFLEAFIRDLSNIDTVLKESFDQSFNPDENTAIDALAEAMVSHLLNSEATFQLITLLMTERDMPEHLKDKFYLMKNELNERVINVLKLSGIKDPDIKTSRAFFASVIGAILLFRNFPERETTKNTDENIIDLVRYIVSVYKAGIQALG